MLKKSTELMGLKEKTFVLRNHQEIKETENNS